MCFPAQIVACDCPIVQEGHVEDHTAVDADLVGVLHGNVWDSTYGNIFVCQPPALQYVLNSYT